MEDLPLPVQGILSGWLSYCKRVPKYDNGKAYCPHCGLVVKPVGRCCPICGKNVRFRPRYGSKNKPKPMVDPDKYLNGEEEI